MSIPDGTVVGVRGNTVVISVSRYGETTELSMDPMSARALADDLYRIAFCVDLRTGKAKSSEKDAPRGAKET